MTRPVRPAPPRARDPYGVGPIGSWLAPVLAIIGLLLVAIVTFNLLQGELPPGIGGSDDGDPAAGDDPTRTAAPSNVVVVPEEATFEGSIVYAKAGNIWIQTDDEVRQLTDTGDDTQPSWTRDGEWITYIHTESDEGRWPVKGVVESYALDVPQLMRIRPDGGSEPERLATSRFKDGRNIYAYWIRQPVPSPDGARIAVVSDAPNPDRSTVVLQLFDLESKKFKKVDVGVKGVLGHQDPEWRPDGAFLLYVRNGREGTRGAPEIMRYNVARDSTRALTGPGYLQPSYSPDGRFIVATKTSALGSNLVILEGNTGRELLRLTDDDASWSPTWSPAGDGIAYLHISGQTVDLRLVRLEGEAPSWTVGETIDLTEVSGLDADSGPDWYIPADLLPASPPPASPSPSEESSPAASPPT